MELTRREQYQTLREFYDTALINRDDTVALDEAWNNFFATSVSLFDVPDVTQKYADSEKLFTDGDRFKNFLQGTDTLEDVDPHVVVIALARQMMAVDRLRIPTSNVPAFAAFADRYVYITLAD